MPHNVHPRVIPHNPDVQDFQRLQQLPSTDKLKDTFLKIYNNVYLEPAPHITCAYCGDFRDAYNRNEFRCCEICRVMYACSEVPLFSSPTSELT